MSAIQILLVLLSGLGVLHGVLLAVFLWVYPRGLHLSNKILSVLLLILSFRVGKSVILEFVDGIYFQLIFLGLATLLLIGPLFYFYTRSVLEKSLRFSKTLFLHLLPFFLAVVFSFWINKQHAKSIPTAVFVAIFCLYYGHYLFYLFGAYHRARKAKEQSEENAPAFQWLRLLTIALAVLWVVYVLNLLEESVPYILGPILYSVIAYGVSFIATRKGYLSLLDSHKYKSTPMAEEDINQVYAALKKLVAEEELYKDPGLTLALLSKRLKVSPQKISMAINSRFGANLNGFINHYRIKQAQELMAQEKFKNNTIASIAFEVGFNSLTSFNTAFKKQTANTPSAYRKGISMQKA